MSCISLKTAMPIITTGFIALSSCVTNPANKLANYVPENSKEYTMFVKGNNYPYIQSKLDSIAYRDVFESTSKAKDSCSVSEFNKIASKVRNGYSSKTDDNRQIINSIKDYLMEDDISYRDYKEVTDVMPDELGHVPPFKDSEKYVAIEIQSRADNWAYKKFFKNIGVFEDIAKKFEEVSKKIKPYV